MLVSHSTKGGDAQVDPKSIAAAVDFFGRPIAAKIIVLDEDGENDENAAPAPPPKKRVKVFYKYHEGKFAVMPKDRHSG